MFLVPAPVQELHADNAYSSHSLIVTWHSAAGVAERYDILLLTEQGLLLSNKSELASAKQHKFEDLTPGKKYKIQMLTVSGGLFSSRAETEGRTGNSYIFIRGTAIDLALVTEMYTALFCLTIILN